MNKHSMIFIGLDTHKEFHEVAYCEEQRGAVPVHYGRIPSSKESVKKLLRQFESKNPNATLHFVYEAGPCGYWIYRLITSPGHCCYVVAPSLIPKKCKRYQRMSKKGKHYNLIITAIAREMAAYIWAIAKEVVLTPVNPKLRLSRVPA